MRQTLHKEMEKDAYGLPGVGAAERKKVQE